MHFSHRFLGLHTGIVLAPSTWAGLAYRNGLCDPNFMFLGDMIVLWRCMHLCFWKSSLQHLNSSKMFWVNGIIWHQNSTAYLQGHNVSIQSTDPSPVDPVWTSWGVPSFGTNLLRWTPLILKMVPLREVLTVPSGHLASWHTSRMARGSHQNQCYLIIFFCPLCLRHECQNAPWICWWGFDVLVETTLDGWYR